MELSIVVPCHNEAESIPLLIRALEKIAHLLPAFEVIFVDDGSFDGTSEVIRSSSTTFSVVLLKLSRNFGHALALRAGLQTAQGEACVTMDADLQDPPQLIPLMVQEWKKGKKVVLAQRINRNSDSFFKRNSAAIFYWLMKHLTKGLFIPGVGDFRLIDRKIVNILNQLKESAPYWRGLVIWIGYERAIVPYTREARQKGESKYTLLKMLSLAFDAIFSFSKFPLQLVSLTGIFISAASLLLGFTYIVLKLSGMYFVPGWLSLVSIITFLGGLQLVSLGIIGQYVGKIYEEVLARPTVLSFEKETITPQRSPIAFENKSDSSLFV